MKVMLDSDVLLDLILTRTPFDVDAALLWDAIQQKKFEAYTTGVIIVNVFYFVKKHKNLAEANMAVATLLKVLQVCTVDTAVLQAARTSAITI